MPRPTSNRERTEEFKEPRKVCVIATEDSKTGAYEYFEEFGQCREFAKHAFKVTIIPSVDGKSAPNHVLENLKEKKRTLEENGFDEGVDKFWIICDVDNWQEGHIESVIQQCQTLKIDYAFSKPCFEIWILYHQENFDNDEVFGSSKECKSAAVALLEKRKGYDGLINGQQVTYAIRHAETAHRPKSDQWPRKQGSHVYKLASYLIA